MAVNAALALIRFTFAEIFHQRAYRLMMAAALLIPWLMIIPMSLFLLDLGKVLADLLFAAEHMLLTGFVFFIALPLMARDIEQKICHLLLTVPLRRPVYLLARYAGMVAALMPMSLVFLASSAFAFVLVAQIWPSYASVSLAWHFPVGGLLLLLPYFALLGLLLLIAVMASGSSETMVFLFLAWLLSWAVPPVLAALQRPEVAQKMPQWLEGLAQGLHHVLPDMTSARMSLEIAHAQWPAAHMLWAFAAEHLAYVALALVLAVMRFERRDLG